MLSFEQWAALKKAQIHDVSQAVGVDNWFVNYPAARKIRIQWQEIELLPEGEEFSLNN